MAQWLFRLHPQRSSVFVLGSIDMRAMNFALVRTDSSRGNAAMLLATSITAVINSAGATTRETSPSS